MILNVTDEVAAILSSFAGNKIDQINQDSAATVKKRDGKQAQLASLLAQQSALEKSIAGVRAEIDVLSQSLSASDATVSVLLDARSAIASAQPLPAPPVDAIDSIPVSAQSVS